MDEPSCSPDSGSEPKKRVANCARCKNHDITVPLKGHKRYCRFAECVCDRCELTGQKQRVMAQHIALRRQQKLEQEMGPIDKDSIPVAQSPQLMKVEPVTAVAHHSQERSVFPEDYVDIERCRRLSGDPQAEMYYQDPLAGISERLQSCHRLPERAFREVPELTHESGCRGYPRLHSSVNPTAQNARTLPDVPDRGKAYTERRQLQGAFYSCDGSSTCVSPFQDSLLEESPGYSRYPLLDAAGSARQKPILNPVDLTSGRLRAPSTPALDLRKIASSEQREQERHKLELLMYFKKFLELSDTALPVMALVAENTGWNKDKILRQLGRAEKVVEDLGLCQYGKQ